MRREVHGKVVRQQCNTPVDLMTIYKKKSVVLVYWLSVCVGLILTVKCHAVEKAAEVS
jgi:hypothetical protein